MKRTLILATICITAATTTHAQQQSPSVHNLPTVSEPSAQVKVARSLFAEINFGYSNHGIVGQATANYIKGDRILSLGAYKSHVCVLNDDKGINFPDSKSTDRHGTITSFSLTGGKIFAGRFRPSITSGLSVNVITNEITELETHVISIPSVWATFIGTHHDEVVLSSETNVTAGIPIEFKVHVAQRHLFGLDAGLHMDLNPERVFMAAILGIRIGKVK